VTYTGEPDVAALRAHTILNFEVSGLHANLDAVAE
jgi:hypothetical protein